MMKKKRVKPAGGFTFTEVMAAILVMTVAVLGTSAYRYHGTLDVRKAELKTTSARAGSLLCETWRGASDPNAFDPVSHFTGNFPIETMASYGAPTTPSGHTTLGTYKLMVEGDDYRATLFWKDVTPGLRALSVVIAWDWGLNGQSMGHPRSKTFRLTTYIAN
jgi:hypothetical protein